MNDQNKVNPTKKEAPQSLEGVQPVTPHSPWRRLLAKKWAFPALYMAAAAIILTLMLVYQNSAKNTLSEDQVGLGVEKAKTNAESKDQPVATAQETLAWPVSSRSELSVALPFFDSKAEPSVKQAAMLQYGDTFTPHVGIDLAREDKQAFDVLAAGSGKVINVEKHMLAGNIVEIAHPNGMVTVYQSLGEVKVAKDQEVKKGDLIGKAGSSELEKDLGSHLHFEVRQGQDGAALNPDAILSDK
ncbi:hypothetical protein J31TS4_42390 [Paenibacillus sp. J31TS4]|uniref:M23 family metallopeptidase n=1 Tax=Paenibacillus sp. J31TS4 TaxID=2807195 RepID=UPI001B13560C|nr:M23 family metallopeptidase [Paenibacillus sp. J31TS4]GIP40959.1 hypothetical protein J31TS4_42390 [Paenibacillus sp. J31TS4]